MKEDIRTIKNTLLFLTSIVIIYLAKILSSLLIPLALALFIALLLQPILEWFQRKSWPFGLSLIAISLSVSSFLFLTGTLIYSTGKKLMAQKVQLMGQINKKLDGVITAIESQFNVSVNLHDIEQVITDFIASDWILKSSGEFANIIGVFSGNFFMTILYLTALLGGILKYEEYLSFIGKTESDDRKLINSFEHVKRSIVQYMKVKFAMSFCTGVSYTLITYFFGLDFSFFWGFIAFTLNFIPTVGSLVATIPPILLGLVQIDGMSYILLLTVLLMGCQLIFGNIIEPKLMGSTLALNTVVVILGLVFWGYIWGIVGMILSVPLLILTKVILSRFKDAEVLVKLLGSTDVNKN